MKHDGDPPRSSNAPHSLEDRIDMVCDAFEAEWRSGSVPRLENFLGGEWESSAEQSLLLHELLLVELEFRRRRGEQPQLSEYQRRFAQQAHILEGVWLLYRPDETLSAFHDRTLADSRSPGDHIDRYVLVEFIGSGGLGEVWQAWDPRLQRAVAIKMPLARKLSGEELHRFLREGRATAQLRHSNLVPVHEVGRDGDTAFIVSDYIAGPNLKQRLLERPPTPKETAEACAALAEALNHAHGQGVIHRDLKPANVLLDQQGQVYITDFGLAKWSQDEQEMTLQGRILGTPAYMSPEQARGEAARVDHRTDVYSLGAMMYEMLTGRRVFEGDVAVMVHKMMHEEPVPPRTVRAQVPRDLETICLKALEKNSARRYATAQEMAVDLRRYLRGEPILARRVGVFERSMRWVRRRPAWAASAVFLLIAAGAVFAAADLATQNEQLLGYRQVYIATDPPGARVTLVPLHEMTREPLPLQMIHASGRSPVQQTLRPGHYLVVAVLDDGRFHEVFRYVPKPSERAALAWTSVYWKMVDDVIYPRPIQIPELSATEGMALIEGASGIVKDAFVNGARSTQQPHVGAFYLDPHELTYGDAKQLVDDGMPPILANRRNLPDEWAATMTYWQALGIAEKVGKRLLTAKEFRYAATACGTSKWPWGDDPPPDRPMAEFGPVGVPAFDRLSIAPRVVGLRSNVAEWTSTSDIGDELIPSNRGDSINPPPEFSIAEIAAIRCQVVEGGDIEVVNGNPEVSAERRLATLGLSQPRERSRPGLGVRFARSVQPRDNPQAFGVSASAE